MKDHFSIIVAGGGINGAGIAQCAAACGYSTLLVEQEQWGSGTSRKSSKLIHGGLRYLQNGQLGLVYESLRERKILQAIAPDLVKNNRFLIPIYRQSKITPWKIRTGLMLYYMLSGFSAANRFSRIPQQEWKDLPLTPEGLTAVFSYHDCQTNDQALTQAVVNSANQMGAELLCPATMVSANRVDKGFAVDILVENQVRQFHCDVMVNAAGPWVNRLVDVVKPHAPQLSIDLVQGSHLVVTPQLHKECFYLEAPSDKRWVFSLPWKDQTLIGTTETLYQGSPEDAECLESEKLYLLEVINHYFPDYKPTVTDTMAGLRVLPQMGKSVHQRSREVVLVSDNPSLPNYIGVYGGKLTTYRATAEKVVKLAAKTLGPGFVKGKTAKIHLE